MHRVGKAWRPVGAATVVLLLGGSCSQMVSAQMPATRGPAAYEVIFEHNLRATMRDGVALRADIYRPRAEGKFPYFSSELPTTRATSVTLE